MRGSPAQIPAVVASTAAEKNFFEFERMLTSGYGDDLKFLILDPEGVQNPYVLSGPRGCIKLGEYSWSSSKISRQGE